MTKASNQLIPTFKAFAVTRLLEEYFPKLVDLQFTAQMEQSLDDISNGQQEYLPYLKDFYLGDNGLDSVVKHQEANIDPRKACTVEIKVSTQLSGSGGSAPTCSGSKGRRPIQLRCPRKSHPPTSTTNWRTSCSRPRPAVRKPWECTPTKAFRSSR